MSITNYIAELQPHTKQKSYYRKAIVRQTIDGHLELYSYEKLTAVIYCSKIERRYRLFVTDAVNYSLTTAKHFNSFCYNFLGRFVDKNKCPMLPITVYQSERYTFIEKDEIIKEIYSTISEKDL